MFLLKYNFILALCVFGYFAIGCKAIRVEFAARPDEYFATSSINFENQSKIECCTKCILDNSCSATNYNGKTSTCDILTQHPNYVSNNVVAKMDWTLYTKSDGCGGNWMPFSQNCYLLVSTKKAWSDADSFCKAENGDLIDIHSAKENDFAYNYMNANDIDRMWIGLTDAGHEGNFSWSSGRALTYTNYADGEPNHMAGEDCIMITEFWNDFSCHATFAFVCKKSFN